MFGGKNTGNETEPSFTFHDFIEVLRDLLEDHFSHDNGIIDSGDEFLEDSIAERVFSSEDIKGLVLECFNDRLSLLGISEINKHNSKSISLLIIQ